MIYLFISIHWFTSIYRKHFS